KDGNVFGNWWHDREDAVQDGQLELSKAIGELTQKSSQLLIVNTAISKVLSDQQGILLQQQQMLKSQAEALQAQNDKIYEQQKALEQQQKEINAANKGLMEAKGLTQEQAQKLVGCVVRVTDAEAKMEASNRALRQSVERQLQDAGEQYLEQLQAGFSAFRQEVAERTAQLSNRVQDSMERVKQEAAASLEAERQRFKQALQT